MGIFCSKRGAEAWLSNPQDSAKMVFAMRRRMIAISLVACLSSTLWVGAHTFYTTKITWSRDVSRIVYRHCASCHHPGGSSFSLLTFKEARPWAESIKHQVLERRMPPWNAVKGFGDFEDDHGLTQEDLEIIGEWVEGGCPEGNPAYLPSPPEFPPPPEGRSMVESSPIIAVLGATVIRHTVKIAGIGAVHVPEGGELQAVAIEPNGTILPLLWVENFNPNWNQVYYFREPLRFPAGTRIQVMPRTGRVLLHTGKPSF